MISIVIPALNSSKTIRACIESVLRQSKDIIVVDNGSTDETVLIAKEYPVTMLKEKKKSSYAARNLGLKNAKFPLVAFIDSDCIASPDWTQNLRNGFKGGAKIVGGPIQARKNSFTQNYYNLFCHNQEEYYKQGLLATSNMAIKKGVGEFLELRSGADFEFCNRFKKRDIAYVSNAEVRHSYSGIVQFLRSNWKYGRGNAQVQKLSKKFHVPIGYKDVAVALGPAYLPMKLMQDVAFSLGRCFPYK